MIGVSILDENADELVELRAENAKLKEELAETKSLYENNRSYFFDQLHSHYHVEKTRVEKMNEMYQAIWGDTPICDTTDATTGFFMEIDFLYVAFKKWKWLIKLLRWGHFYDANKK